MIMMTMNASFTKLIYFVYMILMVFLCNVHINVKDNMRVGVVMGYCLITPNVLLKTNINSKYYLSYRKDRDITDIWSNKHAVNNDNAGYPKRKRLSTSSSTANSNSRKSRSIHTFRYSFNSNSNGNNSNDISSYRLRRPSYINIKNRDERIVEDRSKSKDSRGLVREDMNNHIYKDDDARKKQRSRYNDDGDYVPYDFTIFNEDMDASIDDNQSASPSPKLLSFRQFISDSNVLRNLDSLGYHVPSLAQSNMVLAASQGFNRVVLETPPGSGKTLAYLLSMLDFIHDDLSSLNKHRLQGLVLVPTRELVLQVSRILVALTKGSHIVTKAVMGGTNMRYQIETLRDIKPHIIVATPGRFADIVLDQKKLKLHNVRAVVVDEIDCMLQGSLASTQPISSLTQRHDLTRILQHLSLAQGSNHDDDEPFAESPTQPRETFICFVSATASSTPSTQSFIAPFLQRHHAAHVSISGVHLLADGQEINRTQLPGFQGATHPGITHTALFTDERRALSTLVSALRTLPSTSCVMLFVSNAHKAEILCEQLAEQHVIAAPLHRNASQDDRKEMMKRVADGRLCCLVATDLASRGIDIPRCSVVINYEIPHSAEHYLHRAGRCGRAGRAGLVINIVTSKSQHILNRFAKRLNVPLMKAAVSEGKYLVLEQLDT